MESRRWLNSSQPLPLVRAQLLLYLWALYATLRYLLAGSDASGLVALVLVIGFLAVIASYGIANEHRWGWWLGVALTVAAVVPIAEELTRRPTAMLRPDYWLAVAFPLAIAGLLGAATARDYRRVWFR